MAASKTTKTVEDKIVEKNETATEEQYGWDDMVEITLPRAVAGEAKSWYVAVNGRSYQVPLGKRVEVPYPIYERLMIALDAQQAAQDAYDSVPNEG